SSCSRSTPSNSRYDWAFALITQSFQLPDPAVQIVGKWRSAALLASMPDAARALTQCLLLPLRAPHSRLAPTAWLRCLDLGCRRNSSLRSARPESPHRDRV